MSKLHSTRRSTKKLFVAQCFDRIERGGFARGIKAEENSDRSTETKRKNDRADRNEGGPMRIGRHYFRCTDTEDDSNNSAGKAKCHRFDQELHENVSSVRA